jgi:hypothetical protein
MKKIFYILLSLPMSAVMLFASSGTSEEVGTKTLYPIPSAIMMNAYRYLGTLNAFSVDAVTTNDNYFQGEMVATFTHWIHIDLQRPGKLHIEVDGDLKNRSFYLNNGRFTIYDKDLDYYGKLEVPRKIDTALDDLFEKYDIKTSLANILYSDLDKRTPPKDKGYYFGTSEVDGHTCHHIGFASSVKEIQLWIEKGKRPLIQKFIVVDKTESYLPRSGTVLRWKLNPRFGQAVFDFTPSSNMVQIAVESYAKEEK